MPSNATKYIPYKKKLLHAKFTDITIAQFSIHGSCSASTPGMVICLFEALPKFRRGTTASRGYINIHVYRSKANNVSWS